MKIVDLKRGMDARFEQVDARFEQVDARFEGLERRSPPSTKRRAATWTS